MAAVYSAIVSINDVEPLQPEAGYSAIYSLDGVLLQPPSGTGWVIVAGLPWPGDALSILDEADPAAEPGDVIEWDLVTSPGGFDVTMRPDGTFVLDDSDDGTQQTFQYRLWRSAGGWTAKKAVTLIGDEVYISEGFDLRVGIGGNTSHQTDLKVSVASSDSLAFDLQARIRAEASLSMDLAARIMSSASVSSDLKAAIRDASLVPIDCLAVIAVAGEGGTVSDLRTVIRSSGESSLDLMAKLHEVHAEVLDLRAVITDAESAPLDLTTRIKSAQVSALDLLAILGTESVSPIDLQATVVDSTEEGIDLLVNIAGDASEALDLRARIAEAESENLDLQAVVAFTEQSALDLRVQVGDDGTAHLDLRAAVLGLSFVEGNRFRFTANKRLYRVRASNRGKR